MSAEPSDPQSVPKPFLEGGAPWERIDEEAAKLAKSLQYDWTRHRLPQVAEDKLNATLVVVPVGEESQIRTKSVEVHPPLEGQKNAPPTFLIRLEPYLTLARLNLSVAHEIGHYVLHSKSGHAPIMLGRGGQPTELEREANRFAGALLMPADDIKSYIARNGDALRPGQMAIYFGVTEQDVLDRCLALGIPLGNKRNRSRGAPQT